MVGSTVGSTVETPTKFPKVLVTEEEYGDNYSKDCTFTDREAIVSLGKAGFLVGNPKTYLEPACGKGHLSKAMIHNDLQVTSYDKMDWGYGVIWDLSYHQSNSYDVVITNPPFSQWENFIRRGLEIARSDLFLLFPLRYLEGQRRSHILRETGLTNVLVFAYRLKMYRPDGNRLSGLTAYAWYHWDLKTPRYNPMIDWLQR